MQPPSRWTRREWLSAATALVLASKGAPATAAPFASQRFAVTLRGGLGPGGRDILLIPGLASSPNVWNALTRSVPGHRWHLVHIGGFAGQPVGGNGQGPLLGPLTDELVRYIREAGLRRPAIIGHSMGGTLGLMAALRPASPVERLMVVDMLPDGAAMLGGTSAGLGFLAGQLNGYLTGTKQGRRLLADMVARSPGAQGSDPRVIAQALADLAQTDLGPQLSRLPCPLAVVYAKPADARLRPAQARRYQRAYAPARRAKLIAIGPSGHMVMLDQPEPFAQAVRDFLD